jgi:hypothetical protein
MRALRAGGQLKFAVVEFGESQELLAAGFTANEAAGLRQNIAQLEFWSRLSRICRQIGSVATFNTSEAPDESQLKHLRLAYALADSSSIECTFPAYTLNASPEGVAALKAKLRGALMLRMPLNLSFGATIIGAMPVVARITDYSFAENEDGSVTFQPLSSGHLSLDTDSESVN